MMRFHIFLLLGEGVRFLGIVHAVIYHAPDRRVPGAGHGGHDLNGILAIEHIVDPVPPADLDRIDLMYVKMPGGLLNMGNGQITLIGLVGNQIFDGDLLKMYIRNKSAVGKENKTDNFCFSFIDDQVPLLVPVVSKKRRSEEDTAPKAHTHRWIQIYQLPYDLPTVHVIACKAVDAFCQDQIDFPGFTVLYHPVKFFPFLRTRPAQALVR